MTTTLCGMRKIAPLKWAVLVLTALALAIGCSGEPQVEVEVPPEVVVAVTATPEQTTLSAGSGRKPQQVVQPTLTAIYPSVLIVVAYLESDSSQCCSYTRLSSLALSEGIRPEVVLGVDPHSSLVGNIPEGVDLREYRSVLVQGEPTLELLEEVREFVSSGGNAAFLIPECSPSTESPTNDHLQFSFGISCVITAPFRIRGRGDQFAPLWQDLVMDGDYDSRVDFSPGPSGEFKCVANVKTEGRTVCTALKGTIGAGRVLFIADTRGRSMFSDAVYQRGDHAEATSRLLSWLVEEPSARALPSDNLSDFPSPSNAASVVARFSTSDPLEWARESGSARGDTAGPRGRHANVPP